MLKARKHLENGDRNYTLNKLLPHFEQLEARILLSVDSLLNVIDPLQDVILNDTQQEIQYTELLNTNEQAEQQISLEASLPVESDIESCEPIFTILVDDENEVPVDADLSVDNIESAQVEDVVLLLNDSGGDIESRNIAEGYIPLIYNDDNISIEENTSIEIRGPPLTLSDTAVQDSSLTENIIPVQDSASVLLDGQILFLSAGPTPSELNFTLPTNINAADTLNTDQLWSGGGLGLDLTGSGLTVGIWEAEGSAGESHVRSTHQELTGRVVFGDTSGTPVFSDHATHVAGTIAASGVNAAAHGMATQIDIRSYSVDNFIQEMYQDAGLIVVSNHSYAEVVGWALANISGLGVADIWIGDRSISSTEAELFGKYDSFTQDLDDVLIDNPYLLSVWSAGNDRNDYFTNHRGDNTYVTYFSTNPGISGWSGSGWYLVPNSGVTSAPGYDGNGGTGYDSLPPDQTAKNSLVVGAIDDITADPYGLTDVSMTSFSSWGPTDDGRIKPDVVANGQSVFSSSAGANDAYHQASGTSSAAPNVTGTAALLIEYYESLFGYRPTSATTKGLLIHTAFDAGNLGPDFSYGWGVVDAAAAATFLGNTQTSVPTTTIYEDTYSGTELFYSLQSTGTEPLKATIVWTDPEGDSQGNGIDVNTSVLKHDLDLWITDPNDIVYYPWTLDAASPADSALRNDPNHVDNVEQVLIDVTQSGTYTIHVGSRSVVLPQDFSLLVDAQCSVPQFVPFGGQELISTQADGVWSVYACDLDGDGDNDVLSASNFDDKIAWYENSGGATFGNQQVISTQTNGAQSVYACDLDGDNDNDVLSVSYYDDKIVWYENDGSGTFGGQQVISTLADGARSVYACDLDGDGDNDVLSASDHDDKIAWYENNGSGTFGSQQIISTQVNRGWSVYACDLDGDGDNDVLSASVVDDKIAWYENLGGGTFGIQQVISTQAEYARSVYACDLDGDGDNDVLSASYNDDKIAWYENNGSGNFGSQQVISYQASQAISVYACDLDGDSDNDVLSASIEDDKIAWYENLGGIFGTPQVISSQADFARSVYACDLDGDGDNDVLSASYYDDKVAWYENLSSSSPGPQILLSENFNDGDYNGWILVEQGIQGGPMVWSAATGEMVQSSNVNSPVADGLPKLGTFAYWQAGTDWTDYTATVKMKSNDNDGIGIMFRYQDENNYYRFVWDKERSYRALEKCENGQFSILAQDSVPYVTGKYYQVKIVAQGSTLQVSIDGSPVLSATDSSFSSGTIALYCWGNRGSCFDDVLVEGSSANQAPVISSVTASPSTISDTQTSQLQVVAYDPDSGPNPLTYSWTVPSGQGSLDNLNIDNPVYTPPDVSSTQTFTLTVDVSDGLATTSQTVDITVTDSQGSQILLSEDFNDGNYDGWILVEQGIQGGPMVWSAATGEMIQSSNVNSPIADGLPKLGTFAYWQAGSGWTDYTATVKMKSNDNDGIGIMFRYQDENNYYRFVWDKERSYRALEKCENGQFSILAQDSIPYVTGKYYQVKISAQSSSLQVSIDGSPVLTATDNTFASGTIALYCWGNRGACFDDVLVEGSSGANQAPDISSVTATPSTISDAPGQTSQLQVIATDTDGPNPLTYSWTVPTGAGSLDNYNIDNPIYTPPDVNSTQTFTLTVDVFDGLATTSETVDITVTDSSSGPQILLSEDFNDGDYNGWTLVEQGIQGGSMAWSAATGEMVQSSNNHSPIAEGISRFGTYAYWQAGTGWTDYTATIKMKSDDNDGIGIMFRYQNENNYYRFIWDCERSSRALVECENGQFSILDEDFVPYVIGKYYQVKIVAQGSTLQVSIDGSPVLSASDSTFSSGTIALYCWGNRGSCFDDILVEGSSGANQAPDISSVTASPSTISDAPGQTSQLQVIATDTDGPDPLTYSWTVPTGAGSLDNYNIDNPIYTPPDVSSTQTFTLTVDVFDGLATTSETVDITVTDSSSGPQILLSEDFNDGDYDGWTLVEQGIQGGPMVWSAATGEMVQSSNVNSPVADGLPKLGTFAYWQAGSSWTDCTATVKMKSNDNDGIGIMFRYQDENNYYRFVWDKERSYRALEKCENGQFSILAQDSIPYVTGKYYQVKISAQGSSLQVSIDGSPVFSVSDSTFSSGTIALYCWGNRGSHFDDILVEGSSGANQAPVISSVTASPSTVSDAQTSQLQVSAIDTDGPNPLTYSWIVPTGAGSLDNYNIDNPIYTPPDVSSTQTFTLTVDVFDGLATTSQTVDITVTDSHGPQILLSEDFDDGDYNGWTLVEQGIQGGSMAWSAATGEMVQSSNNHSPITEGISKLGTYAYWQAGSGWTDYAAMVKMKSDDNDGIGIMFRYQDENNYYRFNWDRQRNSRALVKCENGQFSILDEDFVPYVTGKYYQVKISAQGSSLQVSIDGSPVFSVSDSTFSSGTIALYCWANEGTYFDDILVEGSNTTPPPFQVIPIPDRKDHVFDPVYQILYITTQSGTVERYDVTTKEFLSPWAIGGTLGGVDVTPNGDTVLVCDRSYDTTTDVGYIHRVDALSGIVTTLEFPLDGGQPSFTETGSWDVVAMNNGKAFFTADFVGSAWVPLHELDLATNTIVDRPSSTFSGFNEVRERTWLYRDANHSVMLGLESDSSAGPVFSYIADTDSFIAGADLGFYPGETPRSIFHSDGSGSISRDGQWLAIEIEPTNEVWILDLALSNIATKLSGIEGGVIFDPYQDLLYGLDTVNDEVIVFDTNSWSEIKRIDVSEDLLATQRFDEGVLSFDPLNSTVYVSVSGGILPIKI